MTGNHTDAERPKYLAPSAFETAGHASELTETRGAKAPESPGDSALDEAWEESPEEEQSDDHLEEENSDSFVTISDASFTDSEISKDTVQKHVTSLGDTQDDCFKFNPYFDCTLSLEPEPNDHQDQHHSDHQKQEYIFPKDSHNPERNKHNHPDHQDLVRVRIGDPEKLADRAKESCVSENPFPTMTCLPRPGGMFKRSKGHGGFGGLSRSKSEGNIKELGETEKKPLFFTAPFKNLWKKKYEDQTPVLHISSPVLNRRSMVLKTGDDGLGVGFFSSMTDLSSLGQESGRHAFFRKPIFSCLLGDEMRRGGEERAARSSHKTVMRPRDVKMRSQRRGMAADNYHLNYSIC